MNVPYNLDVLRQSNKKLVRLTSIDRIGNDPAAPPQTNSQPTNHQISFNSTGFELTTVKKISLTKFSTNNLFYNVPSYANSFELILYGPSPPEVSFIIRLPVGYYDAVSLAALVQSNVRAQTGLSTFLCTFNTTTYRFSMDSGNAGIGINLGFAVVNPATGLYAQTLLFNMGYSYIPFGVGQVLTAPSMPNLNIQNVIITSTKLGSQKSYKSNSNNSSVQITQLLSVSLAQTPYGATVSYESSDAGQRSDILYAIDQQLDTIDIQLRNETDNILESDFTNNNTIEFTIYY